MEKLKTMVNALDEMNEREQIVKQLQEIGKVLLTEYEIKIGDNIIQPLLVEAYYYEAGKFEDECCHAVAYKSGAIKKLASERQQKFNEIYVHLNKNDGIDLCLGKPGRYLAFLIKNALVNGEFATQYKVSDMICSRCKGCDNGENCKYYGVKVLKHIKKPEANQADNDAKNTKCLFLERLGVTNDCYKAERLAVLSISDLVNYNYDYTLQPYNKLGRGKIWRDAIIKLANDENAYVDCDYSDYEKESDGKLKSTDFNFHKLARIDWNYSKTKFLNKE